MLPELVTVAVPPKKGALMPSPITPEMVPKLVTVPVEKVIPLIVPVTDAAGTTVTFSPVSTPVP
jgi:hypothetical protein